MSNKVLKKLVSVSLMFLTVTVLSILGAVLIVRQRDQQSKSVLGNETTGQSTSQSGNNQITLTATAVAEHSTRDDCWIILSGKVYGVSGFLTAHPGGAGEITPYCGKDAISAFSTKGAKGSNHSGSAYSLLSSYLIGSIGSTAARLNTVNQPVNTGTPVGNNGTLPKSVVVKYPGATIKKQEVEDDGRQKLEIIYNGACYKVKVNSSGVITEDERC